MISYEMTTRLLKDILPVGHNLNASTVRNHLCQVSQRLDAETEDHSGFLSGDPSDWGEPTQARKLLMVGIDGGYVRYRDEKKRKFEIIADKSLSVGAPTDTRRFGLSIRMTAIWIVGSWRNFQRRECWLTSRYFSV